MGLWNNHGMAEDDTEIELGIVALGLSPDELTMLADFTAQQVWVMERIARRSKGQEKRKCNLIAGHLRRRTRKFKELAAMEEQILTEEGEK